MSRSTLAERIADLLVAEGIDHMFSLPEVLLGRVHHALAQRGVPLIANHHEAAGGHMAEAYSLLTGRTTVVGAARGPGVVNTYPAVASAWTEGRPVLFLGPEKSVASRSVATRQTFQSVNAVEVLTPITKYANVLEHPELVDAIFHEAFRQMYNGSIGPAYIGLPVTMVMDGRNYDFAPILPPQQYRPGTVLGAGPIQRIEAAALAVSDAEKPLVLGGSGVYQAGGQEVFRAFVERLGAPVILTHGGQGLLPDTHPLLLEYGLEPGVTFTREADLVVAVGTSIGDKIEYGGATPVPHLIPHDHVWGAPAHQRWVHIDRDPAALGRHRSVDFPILGDLVAVLPQLAARIRPAAGTAEGLAKAKAQMTADYQALWASAPDVEPIHSGRAVVEIQRALPDDAILIGGGGLFGLWAIRYRHHSISAHVKSQKQGNIGSVAPYALGAALAARHDGRRVISIGGDGSFQFYLAEIETAVRYELPVVFIIGYDQGWSDEVKHYLDQVGRTYEVDHSFVRLDAVALAMGAHGEFVTKTTQITPAVERALNSGKPAVVQIVIDRDVNAFDLPDRAAIAGGRDWDHVLGTSPDNLSAH